MLHRIFASYVVFYTKRFAFAAAVFNRHPYIKRHHNELPHSTAKAPRVTRAWRSVMKLLSRFFARREMNLTTALERQRLTATAAAGGFGFIAT